MWHTDELNIINEGSNMLQVKAKPDRQPFPKEAEEIVIESVGMVGDY
mgnify:CR=1 FL=1